MIASERLHKMWNDLYLTVRSPERLAFMAANYIRVYGDYFNGANPA